MSVSLSVRTTWGGRLDGGPRGRRQHADVVAAGEERVDDLPAAKFVTADGVGRVQVAEDQDLHAAVSAPAARADQALVDVQELRARDPVVELPLDARAGLAGPSGRPGPARSRAGGAGRSGRRGRRRGTRSRRRGRTRASPRPARRPPASRRPSTPGAAGPISSGPRATP